MKISTETTGPKGVDKQIIFFHKIGLQLKKLTFLYRNICFD